ncbi:Retrotransposon-like protein 1, partial [Ophiophagus hannah]
MAVAAVMEGEAADWVADLYAEHSQELGDVGLFLDALRMTFEHHTQAQQAEGEIFEARQRGRPVRLAGKLSGWPEQLLVHQFKAGLDQALRWAYVYHCLLPCLVEWFQAATELEPKLKDDKARGEPTPAGPKGQPACLPTTPSKQQASRSPMLCFQCKKPGHRAADCPAATTVATADLSAARPGKRLPNKPPEQVWSTLQLRTSSPVAESGTVKLDPATDLNTSEGEDEGEAGSMVGMAVQPFWIPVQVTTRNSYDCKALVDTSCICCFMSLDTATRIGVNTHRLSCPMRFNQMDGSLLGGLIATHVTEHALLEIGPHKELLFFIIVPMVQEKIVLGLNWLDKWGPTIWSQQGTNPIQWSTWIWQQCSMRKSVMFCHLTVQLIAASK